VKRDACRTLSGYWETNSLVSEPSTRRVARALSQGGKRVHHSTIARGRAEGWRPVPNRLHPLQAARLALDVAAPVLTCDPMAGVEALLERRDQREELVRLPDHELTRRAAREALVAVALLCCELQRQATKLVVPKTLETAMLLNAIALMLKAANDGFATTREKLIPLASPSAQNSS
jgi:hypothetical protein